ncbi:MFS transporter [Microaerobacter geothermalis]|uniref:MFS transporter n=1 Tax=Microaerobacter geothermalis TaxID=674972 RepID=UPI001F40121A|nr:MFS transporter [Microaerobacter geothermalis]MCF6093928.1 MFS transporter [Microaerobacter geothermalis]
MSGNALYWRINGLFFTLFYGFGALYPFLSTYFRDVGLSGIEIGTIMALGPVVAIMMQPIWGMIADKFQAERFIYILSVIFASFFSILFFWANSFYVYLMLMIVIQFFQSSLVPLSDHVALTYSHQHYVDYGNMRLWGSVGFAVAVFVSGYVIEWTSVHSIFLLFSVSFLLSGILMRGLPVGQRIERPKIWEGIKNLRTYKRYLLFLPSAFFIFGPINANNTYLGLLYQDVGGSIIGVGILFLLAVGSEAPFMRWSGKMIRKLGIEETIILAGVVSALRWVIYAMGAAPIVMISIFFLQGISVGLYLAAAATYVRENTPPELQVTALAIYASMGNGLGTMAFNFFGGMVYETFHIYATYILFTVVTLTGILPMIWARIKYHAAPMEQVK